MSQDSVPPVDRAGQVWESTFVGFPTSEIFVVIRSVRGVGVRVLHHVLYLDDTDHINNTTPARTVMLERLYVQGMNGFLASWDHESAFYRRLV